VFGPRFAGLPCRTRTDGGGRSPQPSGCRRLIIDEFAFDKIERSETPQAANLLYKIIDARNRRSTTVVTNIDFNAWGDYLGDPPLAMAFLDRVVDGAIIIKINGKSYRAHRASTKKAAATA